MRVLVTGSEGFVGRRLLPRLEAEGHETIGRDQDLDVTDPQAVEAALAEIAPDAVIHLAALASVARSQHDRDLTFRVNYLGSRSVFEGVLRAAPGARVVWVGSGEVYGVASPGATPFREDDPLRPRSPYARTKAGADLLAADYARRGLDVVRVRPFGHTGPGQSDAFVVPSFAHQLAEIAAGRLEPVLRVGNLDSVRDLLDVDDVVRAYAALLSRDVPAGVYNVASGVGRRIGDVLDALAALAGVTPRVEVAAERFRPTDHGVGDAGRLHDACGWSPEIPFETTLSRVMDDWRERVRGS
ncbi:MAG: NAD-dependent epimerase/dehydratase family protein [Myxococcota bacterium]